MTKPSIVFIHGRSQGGKDPVALQGEWQDALTAGLTLEARGALAGVEVRFPFYGDILDKWTAGLDEKAAAGARGTGDLQGADWNYLNFQAEAVGEILARHGIDAAEQEQLVASETRGAAPRSPEWVQGLFRLLDRLPGATGGFIAAVMRDVYVYLNNRAAQKAVDDCVGEALHGRAIVVAHSLGTVVGYRLLKSADNIEVPLLLSLGSPLGIGPIRKAVAPRKFPACVKRWVNGFDQRDDVALYPLGKGRFPVDPSLPIEDIDDIQNKTANHHGIVEYLNKPAIASLIEAWLR